MSNDLRKFSNRSIKLRARKQYIAMLTQGNLAILTSREDTFHFGQWERLADNNTEVTRIENRQIGFVSRFDIRVTWVSGSNTPRLSVFNGRK